MPSLKATKLSPEQQQQLVMDATGLASPMGVPATILARGKAARSLLPALKGFLEKKLTPEAYERLMNIGPDIKLHLLNQKTFDRAFTWGNPASVAGRRPKVPFASGFYKWGGGSPSSSEIGIAPSFAHRNPQDYLNTILHEVGHAYSERMPEMQKQSLGILHPKNFAASTPQLPATAASRAVAFGKSPLEVFAEDFAEALLNPGSPPRGMMQVRRIMK